MAETTNRPVYVSKDNLEKVLQHLKTRNAELYLGINAQAKEAAKVSKSLKLTVGTEPEKIFDGSVEVSAAVAAKEHRHEHTDINGLTAEIKKVVFGDENNEGTVTAHSHENLEALDKISDDYITKWNAKIGVDDVASLKYSNPAMTGVTDVKKAIDVLVKNIQINSVALSDATANVNGLATRLTQAESDIDALETAVGNASSGLVKDVADLKAANAEGGAVANAIAAAKKAGDDAQKDVNALAGKVGTVEEGKTVVGLIGEAKTQADKGVADAAAEATRAQGIEDGLRKDLGQKADPAAADGSAFARIAQVKADLADEVTRAKAAEKEAKDAADAAQADVDALKVKVGDAANTADDATVYGAIAAEKARAEGKEGEIKAIADKNKEDIATLNGNDTVEGSVDKKIKDAINQVNTTAAGLGGRVDALEGKVGAAGDAAAADGSLYARVAKNVADIDAIEADYLKAADKTALENAIKAEKDRMDAFMADADVSDKAIDTLKEIQAYITSDGKAADEMTKNIAANKTAIDAINHETTGILAQAKADAAAKDEALHTEITGEIATAKQGAIDAAASDATTKVNDAKTALQANIDKKADQTALQAEIDRATAAEAANKAVLDKLDGGVNVDGSVKKQIETARAALQANIDTKVAQEAYNTKVAALEAADTKLSERIAKFEGDGEGSVAAQVKAVADDLKAHKEAQVTKEKAVDDKLAVIQGEADVEGSIKKALADAKKYADDEDARIEALLGTKEDAKTAETAFGKIAAEAARATAAEEALGGRLTTAESDITNINTDITNMQALLNQLVPLPDDELMAMLNRIY